MSDFFKNIGKIPYEGKDSTNPLALPGAAAALRR